MADAEASSGGRTVLRLLLASFLMLFLELALIRWLGANIVHLSYFSNFVLLGSFLGIGAGFLISRKRWSIWPARCRCCALLVVGRAALSRSRSTGPGSDVIYFTSLHTSGPPAWLALPIVFAAGGGRPGRPAEVVGRCFGQLPPADGLPLGPDRLAGRDRAVHGAVASCGRRRWSGA